MIKTKQHFILALAGNDISLKTNVTEFWKKLNDGTRRRLEDWSESVHHFWEQFRQVGVTTAVPAPTAPVAGTPAETLEVANPTFWQLIGETGQEVLAGQETSPGACENPALKEDDVDACKDLKDDLEGFWEYVEDAAECKQKLILTILNLNLNRKNFKIKH